MGLLKAESRVGLALMLAAVDAPHFYCGIVLKNDVVILAAPIVKYMRGWSRDKVRTYCKQKGWKISVIQP